MVLSERREYQTNMPALNAGKNSGTSSAHKSGRRYRDLIIEMVAKSNLTIETDSADYLSGKAIARSLFSVYAFADIAGYDIGQIFDDIEQGNASEQTYERYRQLECAAFRTPNSRWVKKKHAALTRH